MVLRLDARVPAKYCVEYQYVRVTEGWSNDRSRVLTPDGLKFLNLDAVIAEKASRPMGVRPRHAG